MTALYRCNTCYATNFAIDDGEDLVCPECDSDDVETLDPEDMKGDDELEDEQ